MANTHSLDLELSSSQFAYITDANQTGLDITGDISIEAWIKPESIDINSAIISKFRGVDGKRSYTLAPKSTNKITFTYSSNGTAVTNCSTDDAILTSANVWYHIAITADVSEKDVKFYVNGTPVNCTLTDNSATSIYNSAMPFIVGAQGESGAYGGYFDGLIDEVRVWNDVRTGQEISDNYQKELVGNEAGLVGYWKFNNNAEDTTSNNNDLTLSGSPSYSTDVPSWNFVLAVDTLALALTYNAVTLTKAIKIVVDTMALTLTYADVFFGNAYHIAVDTMALTLTYADATLKKASRIAVDTMALILNFKDVLFKGTFWTNESKPSSTWTNSTKPTTVWTKKDK